MHDLPASRINKNSPAVMAARLLDWIEGVKAMADRFIDYPPTKREFHLAAASPDHERFTRIKNRFAEGIPRIISQDEADMLVHVRRVEYKLRCLILWLAATLVEKAQKSPEFYSSLFPAKAGISPGASQPDPRFCGDERNNNPNQIPSLVWSQELHRRKEMAKTLPIGGFSVTTPVIEGTCRSRRRRGRKLRADVLRQVDARHLVARLLRLPRILTHADQMAERLARKALTTAHDAAATGEQSHNRGHPVRGAGQSPALQTRDLTRSQDPGSAAHHYMLRSIRDDKSTLPAISVSLATKPPPNPLYFEPFQHWLPPDDLWESAEDDEERGDLTWLHHIAGETLRRIGFSPGEEKGSCLPDLSRFEPPSPPQIRTT